MTPCGSYADQHQLHVYGRTEPDILETALKHHAYFSLSKDEAKEILREVAQAVSKWESVAKMHDVRGIEDMRTRFWGQENIESLLAS